MRTAERKWTVAQIDEAVLDDLALGATVLGTGGGGDPYVGCLMAREAIRRKGPVPLMDVEALPERGLVVPVAMMGAPTVLVEKLPSGEELARVVRALERRVGRPVVALMSAEAGGVNSTIPVAAAAELGLPLLDADGMGRAFPEIPMCSMHLAGVAATPMALADEKGNLELLETVDNFWTERLSRTATVAMGGSSIIALYPMEAGQVRGAVIAGTIGRAIGIGRVLREARSGGFEVLEALLDVTGGRLLFAGKVVDVLRRTQGGFVRGTASLDGTGRDEGSVLRLEFQNENLVAVRDGLPLASVPDLLSVLDAETHTPITTEGLAYGQRVELLGIPSEPVWRTPQGLELVGPRAFGYDFDFIPLERGGSGERGLQAGH
ncbi:MAG: DUF917 domain-containing protein [Bacillota bacterium]|nr:DUF917 domain-containing protein [Bacillota bacterium]